MDKHLNFGEARWICDWGEFVIPGDVPIRSFRKDGWFDRRRKITKRLREYFAAMNERLRDGNPILTWAEWTAPSVTSQEQ